MHRLGIIGCGFIANCKHLISLAELKERVEIVAFCDLIEERAVKAAKEFGGEAAKVYTDYRELLKDESIDIVHVCTPNVSHCEISCAAMEAGKHVMCEKPMAINTEEARKMLDTAKRTGKKLTIGYQNRFRDDSIFLKKVVEEGTLGDIYYGKAYAIRRRGIPTWGVFTDKSKQGGGPLIDIGTHALDLTLWYMDNYDVHSVTGVSFEKMGNDPASCYGNNNGPWDTDTYDVEDSAMGFIKMKNGAVIVLESAWALNTLDVREARCQICGTKAGAEMYKGSDESFQCRLNMTMGERLVTVNPEFAISKQSVVSTDADGVREQKAWLDAIDNDTEPVVRPEQALKVTQILEAIYQSSATGKEVLL